MQRSKREIKCYLLSFHLLLVLAFHYLFGTGSRSMALPENSVLCRLECYFGGFKVLINNRPASQSDQPHAFDWELISSFSSRVIWWSYHDIPFSLLGFLIECYSETTTGGGPALQHLRPISTSSFHQLFPFQRKEWINYKQMNTRNLFRSGCQQEWFVPGIVANRCILYSS